MKSLIYTSLALTLIVGTASAQPGNPSLGECAYYAMFPFEYTECERCFLTYACSLPACDLLEGQARTLCIGSLTEDYGSCQGVYGCGYARPSPEVAEFCGWLIWWGEDLDTVAEILAGVGR